MHGCVALHYLYNYMRREREREDKYDNLFGKKIPQEIIFCTVLISVKHFFRTYYRLFCIQASMLPGDLFNYLSCVRNDSREIAREEARLEIFSTKSR